MSDPAFRLDPALDAPCVALGHLSLCTVLLKDDRRFPWLILVPARPGLVELLDLEPADRALLMEEIATASAVLKARFRPDKLNVAALGNRVAQLHVHVIARFQSDAAWPDPVWSARGPDEPYPPHALGAIAGDLGAAFGAAVAEAGPGARP